MVRKEDNDELLCGICDSRLTKVGAFYICENCRTVARIAPCDEESVRTKAIKTFECIQRKLMEQEKDLYSLEKKKSNGEQLIDREVAKVEYCNEFRECKMWMELFKKENTELSSFKFRNVLYALLMLSQHYSEVFGEGVIFPLP